MARSPEMGGSATSRRPRPRLPGPPRSREAVGGARGEAAVYGFADVCHGRRFGLALGDAAWQGWALGDEYAGFVLV